MDDDTSRLIDVGQLRRGLFVQLDLGWMDHPFPKGSFKISSDDQIRTIRSLGLTQIRYFPAKSDPSSEVRDAHEGSAPAAGTQHVPGSPASQQLMTEADLLREQRRAQLQAQQLSLQACERRFGEATRQYHKLLATASAQPVQAREQCVELVGGCVSEILGDGEAAIRLLSETNGDRSAMHPVNVMVISLLLGKALGLSSQALADLGVAALVHDIGKEQLPERMRSVDDGFSAREVAVYREHVEHSVKMGKRMGLSEPSLCAIAEHHEMVDGSGFPMLLRGDAMSAGGRILALVNKYDNMCNPARLMYAMTPHEALSIIFANLKSRFDAVTLGAFIRMMGVYPPGSVVQLVNERYAIVVSVNSARPLKPRVIVHDASVPREEALILDLERTPELGIRRSLKPSQLPRAAQDYLAPRQRIGYFYERQTQPAPALVPGAAP